MSAGGSVSAFAGESASLVSGRVSVSAAESLHVATKDWVAWFRDVCSVGMTRLMVMCLWRRSDVSVSVALCACHLREDVGVTSG